MNFRCEELEHATKEATKVAAASKPENAQSSAGRAREGVSARWVCVFELVWFVCNLRQSTSLSVCGFQSFLKV